MPVKYFREFIKLETSGGIILFVTAILAIVIDNSPFHHIYQTFFNMPLVLQLGKLQIAKPLLLWINDGFMAVFFMLVGLEIKREMFEGELNTLSKASLPAIAAFGGMLVPALIYIYFNWGSGVALHG